MNFSKFLENKTGKMIASIILGLGLATLFRQVCNGQHCIIEYAVPQEEIKDQVYKYNNKCYKYNVESTKCDSKKKIVEFA